MNEQLLLTSDQEYELAFEDARFNTSHMDCRERAIMRLKRAAERSKRFYHQPLLVCYSGGKDSDAVLELAKESGIDFEVVHSHTTADAPQTVYHVRKKFAELECLGVHCSIKYPYYQGCRTSMWNLIIKKGFPPTKMARYCCDVLKETAGNGRSIATGVRWTESTKRKASRGIYEATASKKENRITLINDNDDTRKLEEKCMKTKTTTVNPIIDWSDEEVYKYLENKRIELNPLYYCGHVRVGCIGCPMAGRRRWDEFREFPKYKELYINTFDRMIKAKGDKTHKIKTGAKWNTGYDVFLWWMDEDPNQMTLFDELEED